MSSEEEIDTTVDWSNLKTIKTLDLDDNDLPSISKVLHQSAAYSLNTQSSTKLVDNTPSVRDNFSDAIATQTKTSAPVSLLVESLVQQLCSMIETEPARADKLYKTICKQLHHMNLIDETYAMGEFDVMRSQYQRALYQLATVARGQTEIPMSLQSVWPLSDSIGMAWSRYFREFDELNFVAGGGFGRVYRARHKLDGIEYAVKKVTIKYRTVKRVLSHLSEVKTFASLNHTNIVPYKAAWLEPLFDSANTPPRITASKQRMGRPSVDKKNSNISGLAIVQNGLLNALDIDEDVEDEEDSESDENESETDSSDAESTKNQNHLQLPTNPRVDESSEFVLFEQNDAVDGANCSRVADISSEKQKRNKVLCKASKRSETNSNTNFMKGNIAFDEAQPHLKLKWATLYIQMSFRPLTLRAWLDERNKHDDFNEFYKKFIEKSVRQLDNRIDNGDGEDDDINQNMARRRRRSITKEELDKNLSKTWTSEEVTMNIFCQTMTALRYIHLQNIVHHDIKPSNIFIGCEKSGELYVQLGDFGLACPLHTKHPADAIIGTPTYAAAEQLGGQCNPKSDIFSLGIILLELLIPFSTDMERQKTIEKARKGILPSNIPPKFAHLLNRLFQHHKKRPDASQVFDLISNLELNANHVPHSSQDSLSKSDKSEPTHSQPNNREENPSIQRSNTVIPHKRPTDRLAMNENEESEKNDQSRIAHLETELEKSKSREMELNKEIALLRSIIRQRSDSEDEKCTNDFSFTFEQHLLSDDSLRNEKPK